MSRDLVLTKGASKENLAKLYPNYFGDISEFLKLIEKHLGRVCVRKAGRWAGVDFASMRPLVYDSTRRIYRVVGEEVGGAWEACKALM